MDEQKKTEVRDMLVHMHGLIKRQKHTVGKLLKVCVQVLDDCDIVDKKRGWALTPEEVAIKRKRLQQLRDALRTNLPLFEDDPPEVLATVVGAASTDLNGFEEHTHD